MLLSSPPLPQPTPQSQGAPRLVMGFKWQSTADMLFHVYFLETEHT
jgi:hypothetical protein